MVWLFVTLAVVLIAFVAWTASRDRRPSRQPATIAEQSKGSGSQEDQPGGHRGGCCG